MRGVISESLNSINQDIDATQTSIRDLRTNLTDQASITSPEIIGLTTPVFTNEQGETMTALDIDQIARASAFKSKIDKSGVDPFTTTRDTLIQGGFISGTPEENEQVLELLVNHGIATSTQAGEEAVLSPQVQNELNIIAQEQTRLNILQDQRLKVQERQLQFDQGLRNAVNQGLVFEDPLTGAMFGTALDATSAARVPDIPLSTGLPGTLVPTGRIEQEIQQAKPKGELQKFFENAAQIGEDISNLFKPGEGAQRQAEALRNLPAEPNVLQEAVTQASTKKDQTTQTVVGGVISSISKYEPPEDRPEDRLSPGSIVENVSFRINQEKGRPITIEERKQILDAVEKRNRELDSQTGGLQYQTLMIF